MKIDFLFFNTIDKNCYFIKYLCYKFLLFYIKKKITKPCNENILRRKNILNRISTLSIFRMIKFKLKFFLTLF